MSAFDSEMIDMWVSDSTDVRIFNQQLECDTENRYYIVELFNRYITTQEPDYLDDLFRRLVFIKNPIPDIVNQKMAEEILVRIRSKTPESILIKEQNKQEVDALCFGVLELNKICNVSLNSAYQIMACWHYDKTGGSVRKASTIKKDYSKWKKSDISKRLSSRYDRHVKANNDDSYAQTIFERYKVNETGNILSVYVDKYGDVKIKALMGDL